MAEQQRRIVDARTDAVITTLGIPTSNSEVVPVARVRIVPATTGTPVTVRVPTRPRLTGRRIAFAFAVAAGIDFPVLGFAGYLVGQSASGAALLAVIVAAVLGVLLVAVLGSGRVHCPGCPE